MLSTTTDYCPMQAEGCCTCYLDTATFPLSSTSQLLHLMPRSPFSCARSFLPTLLVGQTLLSSRSTSTLKEDQKFTCFALLVVTFRILGASSKPLVAHKGKAITSCEGMALDRCIVSVHTTLTAANLRQNSVAQQAASTRGQVH
jgi:hypothetical protein